MQVSNENEAHEILARECTAHFGVLEAKQEKSWNLPERQLHPKNYGKHATIAGSARSNVLMRTHVLVVIDLAYYVDTP
ncbi:hypothetical protein FOYG_14092 [Fusarium oxysporum NRRL 32931]|uniref:Uncharacterized protein n=1 Tax=Fusarium oxysporum NRRL 32931 TaxID=660029 RepID=W9HTL4_FUSOX|nr:hypothetical protein FOYG_14092 [Fusarium oxysporum NRRL 32931]